MPPTSSPGSLSPDDASEPFALGPPPPVATPANAPPPRQPAAAPRQGHASSGHTAAPPARLAPSAAPTAPPEDAPIAAEGSLVFPLFDPPLANYKTGARWYGAPRSGGRHHAAVDLIAPHLARIRAVADGVVVQAPYYFYTGTNALEVRHPGIGVVRYGEIDVRKVVHLEAGDRVSAGQVIAYVGRLDSGSSMLHFELYSGKASGALTVRGNPPYQRRRDLVDPTSLMDRLLPQVQRRH